MVPIQKRPLDANQLYKSFSRIRSKGLGRISGLGFAVNGMHRLRNTLLEYGIGPAVESAVSRMSRPRRSNLYRVPSVHKRGFEWHGIAKPGNLIRCSYFIRPETLSSSHELQGPRHITVMVAKQAIAKMSGVCCPFLPSERNVAHWTPCNSLREDCRVGDMSEICKHS